MTAPRALQNIGHPADCRRNGRPIGRQDRGGGQRARTWALTAYATGNGRINLGGTAAHSVDASRPVAAGCQRPAGRPGRHCAAIARRDRHCSCRPTGGAGIADGEKFSISDGRPSRRCSSSTATTSSRMTDRNSVADNRLIQYAGNETQDALAASGRQCDQPGPPWPVPPLSRCGRDRTRLRADPRDRPDDAAACSARIASEDQRRGDLHHR